MSYFKILKNGLINENPTFVLLLGMCPTLGTTSSAINGLSMGLATTFVLILSNFIISLIKNLVPDQVRIPSYIVVIASLVTILQMLMQAYLPSISLVVPKPSPLRTVPFPPSLMELESVLVSQWPSPFSVPAVRYLAQA